MKLFATIVNYGVKNLSAYLTADIDLNPGTVFDSSGDYSGDTPSEWTSIGNSADNAFTGTFDGKGYTIKGLYSTTGGLFGYLGDATIQNLNIENSIVKANGNNGLLANELIGTDMKIENYSVAGYVEGFNAGGFIGRCAYATFADCKASARVNCSGYAGGYIGMVYEGYSFVRCSNKGNVNSHNSDAGGFIGSAYSDFSIKNCYKTGYIESNNSMYNKPFDGAVVGHLECYATIDNLYYTLNGWYEEDLVGEYAVGEHIDESTCYYIYGDQFASGEVAYKLNGNTSEGDLVWGQTIGTEYYPVLGGKTVYYGTNCAFDFVTDYLANCDLPGSLTQLEDTQADELSTYKSSYTPMKATPEAHHTTEAVLCLIREQILSTTLNMILQRQILITLPVQTARAKAMISQNRANTYM